MLELWCLTPLSTIFQLYCDGQVFWWINFGETHRPVASKCQTLQHNINHAMGRNRTHNFNGDRH